MMMVIFMIFIKRTNNDKHTSKFHEGSAGKNVLSWIFSLTAKIYDLKFVHEKFKRKITEHLFSLIGGLN